MTSLIVTINVVNARAFFHFQNAHTRIQRTKNKMKNEKSKYLVDIRMHLFRCSTVFFFLCQIIHPSQFIVHTCSIFYASRKTERMKRNEKENYWIAFFLLFFTLIYFFFRLYFGILFILFFWTCVKYLIILRNECIQLSE